MVTMPFRGGTTKIRPGLSGRSVSRMGDRSGGDIAIQDAVQADLPATLEIYNELIPTTTVAWTEELQTIEERRAWFAEQRRRGFPVIVAVDGGTVVGTAAYGDFRDSVHWPGYRFTAE